MTGGWCDPVRAYCERRGPEVFAEPLNAASNAAFLIAAVLLLREMRRDGARDATAASLAWLVGVIGIGSLLFHTLAVRWSELVDVIPIAIFIHVYLFVALRRLLGLGGVAALAVTLAFAAGGAGFEPAASALAGRSLDAASNGSIAYAPAALALLAVGAGAWRIGNPAGPRLIGLCGVFLVSLTARSLDAALCGAIPFGTHWLWHILNAVLLAGLVRVLRGTGRPGPAPHG
jgi:hypothetical protein